MSPGTGRFRAADRLLRSREFQRARRHGRSAVAAEFVVVVHHRSDAGESRLGVSVSRRVGGAVVRNRIKRRVREWFRSARPRITPGADVVVIARHGAGRIDTRTTWRALDELLRSAERGAS